MLPQPWSGRPTAAWRFLTPRSQRRISRRASGRGPGGWRWSLTDSRGNAFQNGLNHRQLAVVQGEGLERIRAHRSDTAEQPHRLPDQVGDQAPALLPLRGADARRVLRHQIDRVGESGGQGEHHGEDHGRGPVPSARPAQPEPRTSDGSSHGPVRVTDSLRIPAPSHSEPVGIRSAVCQLSACRHLAQRPPSDGPLLELWAQRCIVTVCQPSRSQ